MAIKPSPHLVMLLLLLHVPVAAVVFVTVMPLVVRLALILLITLSLIYYLLRDALLLLANSWREVTLASGGLTVVARDGSRLLGQVAHKTTVSPYFIVLRVKIEGQHLPVSRVIFPDALGADAYREFCVALKFA